MKYFAHGLIYFGERAIDSNSSKIKKLSYYNFVKDIRTELIHAVLTLLLENTVIILLEDFFLHAQFPVTVFQ